MTVLARTAAVALAGAVMCSVAPGRLVAAAAAGIAAPAPPNPVLGAASVAGIVVNATTGRPLSGQTVELIAIRTGGPAGAGQTRTDAAGRFAFQGRAPGRYLVQVMHQGVPYAAHARIGAPTAGAPGAGRASTDVVIRVYDVTAQAPLRLSLLGLAVDVQPGYVRVTEVARIHNAARQTYRGSVRLGLPRDARFVTYEAGFAEPRVDGDAIVDTVVIRPGEHEIAYGYSVAGAGEVDLAHRIPFTADRVEVFTRAPARTHAQGMTQQGAVVNEGGGFTRASGGRLPAGEVAFRVVGVPPQARWPAPAAAGALAGLLALGTAAAVARRRGTLGPPSTQ